MDAVLLVYTFILSLLAWLTVTLGSSRERRATNCCKSPDSGLQHDLLVPSQDAPFTVWHAALFIIFTSILLLILYFTNLSDILVIIYGLYASVAISTVWVHPTLKQFRHFCNAIWNSMFEYNEIVDNKTNEDRLYGYGFIQLRGFTTREGSIWSEICDVTFIIANTLSLCIVILWYLYRSSTWAWIFQDFMGISVCLLCMRTILMPNLKVVSVLLGLALIYDIFFVLLTPYMFESSVMQQVALGNPDGDENLDSATGAVPSPVFTSFEPNATVVTTTVIYCDEQLNLPTMLLVPVPLTLLESYCTSVLLGLGDIIIPGLCVVWAIRQDHAFLLADATATITANGSGSSFSNGSSSGSYSSRRYKNAHERDERHMLFSDNYLYYQTSIIAYGVGLVLANIAMLVTKVGQPALLYIVPSMLGSIIFISYRNGELSTIWKE